MDDRDGVELLDAEGPPASVDELATLLLGVVNLDRIPDATFERSEAERANADPAALAVVGDCRSPHRTG